MGVAARIPITNQVTGSNFTATLRVGSAATRIDVMLDTGSSMLTVDGSEGAVYDVATDTAATTTELLQTASFASGTLLAAVVHTPVGLVAGDAAAPTVPGANLAVAYDVAPGLFAGADGILGLAYRALNKSYRMPGDTTKTRYPVAQVEKAQPAEDLDTYLDQAVAAGLAANKFAFGVRRSVVCQAADSALAARQSSGVFVLGGAEECTDLYTGAFADAAVVHDDYFNTNLVAVRVGERAVEVPAAPAAGTLPSNSVVDSGNGYLMLDADLHEQVIGLFHGVEPRFAAALQAGGGQDQAALDLAAWPNLGFVLQGTDGGQVTIDVTPEHYWQFDSYGPGQATSGLAGTSPHAGRSILGLPLFAGRYVVFDRSAANGQGVVRFAALR